MSLEHLPFLIFALAMTGCRVESTPDAAAEAPCDEPALREVVDRFGAQMQRVPLLAEDTLLRREIRERYGDLVSAALLDSWLANPAAAPGRSVSSPWPERVELRSVEAAGPAECIVHGDVIFITSAELPGEAAAREPVRLRLQRNGEWQITAYEPTTG